jgi:alpha-mannosidase
MDSEISALSTTINRLRQLTQVSIQPNWRLCSEDLPANQATQPESWQHWAIAELNARNHVVWDKGRRVVWLAQVVVIPEALQSYPLAGLSLRLALTWWADVAALYVNGQKLQEGDLFDCSTRMLLSLQVQPGDTFAIAIRLVSPDHDDGALVRSDLSFESTAPEFPEPSFVADELGVLQRYWTAFDPEKIPELESALTAINWSVVSDRPPFDRSLQQLRQQLAPWATPMQQHRIWMLGHAHLDMAWLWTVQDTWVAAERTFQSVLQLQQEFPDLIFGHSTPALYAWLEAHRPDLFQAIQQQVAAGRWEIVGGLWVEPDLNLIDGESIVRQVLYGQHYVQEKFGALSTVAWVPDSFGFCGQLPQILKQGGVEYFVTQKLRWNDTTQFPYEAFWWQAPDGTQLFSLMSALIGQDTDPLKMSQYAWDWLTHTNIQECLWLPGVGDHGGGPTRDMLEVAQRWQHSKFFPQTGFQTSVDYLRSLRQTAATRPDFPVWSRDLYLEFHRGCYTTHADQKRWNRHAETLVYQAELYAAFAHLIAGVPYPHSELETAWKRVLFNQFHDILPGSSIPEVFIDANREWQAVNQTGTEILARSLQAIAAAIDYPHPPCLEAQPLVVFNSMNWQRSQVVEIAVPGDQDWQIYDHDGQRVPSQHVFASSPRLEPFTDPEKQEEQSRLLFFASQIPSVGYRVFWLAPVSNSPINAPEQRSPLPSLNPGESNHLSPHFEGGVGGSTTDFTLENEPLRVVVDPQTGELASVFDKAHCWEVLAGAGNQLQAFQDQGQYWDAWNIDPNYAQHPLPPPELQSIQWLERGDLQQRLRVVRKLGRSTVWQDYVLQAESPVLQIQTKVDWQECHVLLKAVFPLNLEVDSATYETPCAAIARTTRPTEPRDKAQWEVPALRWADLSAGDYGVSLLNDCKYGYDAQPSQLRLTLLRSSQWPDPDADRGWHQFTYALYPHQGSWQAAQTVQRGYELNRPLLVQRSLEPHRAHPGKLPAIAHLLDLGADNLVLMALKQSEQDPEHWILRCYECHGFAAQLQLHSHLDLALAEPVDLLEVPIDPAADPSFPQGRARHHPYTDATIKPWQIHSLRLVFCQGNVAE